MENQERERGETHRYGCQLKPGPPTVRVVHNLNTWPKCCHSNVTEDEGAQYHPLDTYEDTDDLLVTMSC